jgi:hypothetical protein
VAGDAGGSGRILPLGRKCPSTSSEKSENHANLAVGTLTRMPHRAASFASFSLGHEREGCCTATMGVCKGCVRAELRERFVLFVAPLISDASAPHKHCSCTNKHESARVDGSWVATSPAPPNYRSHNSGSPKKTRGYYQCLTFPSSNVLQ